MKKLFAQALLAISLTSTLVQPVPAASVVPQRFSVALDDMEPVGPFTSWGNAKRDYGAVGDGVVDDTAALQKALNDLGHIGRPSVLYLPAGTYKITRSLVLTGLHATGRDADWGGVSVIGESPSSTKILWNGPPGQAMLIQNGGYNTRYSRLTWDGNKTAGYGIAHWWDTTAQTYYDGSSEDTDEVFQDMAIGISTGRLGARYGQMNSEGQIRRVTFLRNWQAGVNTGSWNALDWWIWDSRFIDCARGVSNLFSIDDMGPTIGAGAAYVYRSLFERSKVADINVGNVMWFSMHNNVSVGSRRFFQGEGMGRNGAEITLQNNRILNTTDPVSIANGNLGPLILIDNEIRSASTTGAVVQLTDWEPGADIVSIGNRYTHARSPKQPNAAPILVAHQTDRVTSIADSIVSQSSISMTLPTLPGTPAWKKHHVVEVDSGSDAKAIQSAINAAASKDTNPVVHLPPGKYYLTKTLVVPAKARLQLAGDGLTTILWWKGSPTEPMIRLEGPSYATIRDLQMIGFKAPSIEMPNADQRGGRIFVEGTSTGPISVTSLRQTQLTMQANPLIGRITLDSATNVVSIGAGGSGPLLTLKNESSALFADTWYEGPETELYRLYSGNLTFIGGVLAPATHAQGRTDTEKPTILLDGFNGKASFIGFRFDLNELTSGLGIVVEGESSKTHAMFLGAYANKRGYFHRVKPAGKVGLMSSRTVNQKKTAEQAPEEGSLDPDFVLDMLMQARSLQWDTVSYSAPLNSTDVRLYRVRANQSAGIRISGH